MKKTLLLLFFMFYGFTQAQDFAYIKSLNSLNNESARIFSDQVVADSKTKYEFLRIDETTKKSGENSYEVVYIPIDAVDKAGKEKPFVMCDECLKVRFVIYSLGENKDLEIKGVRRLFFDEVSGRYLDLFPVWKKIFKPNADVEKTLDDYDSRQLDIKEPRINYKFSRRNIENNWFIHNYS
jgi:hypothetical protein